MAPGQSNPGYDTNAYGVYGSESLCGVSPEIPCPYLPDRDSRHEAYRADWLEGALYERLMARGFRRCGRIVYRPQCRDCRDCHQIRILTDRFTPTRSMRRVWRANQDLHVEVGTPEVTNAKYNLYVRYLDAQHDTTMSRSYEAFCEFLYDSPTDTIEVLYKMGNRLVGVSLVDRCPKGLSSVYMFFDPSGGRRSLGTFSVLWEIEHAKTNAAAYYYLGYYVPGSRTMAYKSRFKPAEILVGDNRWLPLGE